VVATVPVGSNPRSLAIDPTGSFAYVPNQFDNTISVISTATNSVVATVGVGPGPLAIAFAVSDPLQSLLGQIQALIDAGTLTESQGDVLLNKIAHAIGSLDNGQTNAACGQLDSFINQVNAFINNGSLTQAQGQTLIDAANATKASNGC
jgi:YVTN family beta-propeller protein